jgi:hypothetical protein
MAIFWDVLPFSVVDTGFLDNAYLLVKVSYSDTIL